MGTLARGGWAISVFEPIVHFVRRGRTASFYILTFVLVTAAAIWLALRVTPLQTVSAAGQTAQVGATLPNTSLDGPGELDLFGQVIPTTMRFTGPIRPRLELEHISISPQVVQMLRSDGPHGVTVTLSQQLAAGWERYCVWESLIAVAFAVVLLVAIGAVRWKPAQRMPTLWKFVLAGVVVVCVVNVGGILLTASGTPRALRSVRTLDDLAGVDSMASLPPAGKPQPGVQAVVIGDSTASGYGLPWGPSPTALDKACGRSPDAYAGDLASANNWNVLNVACGGATIKNGLLGAQVLYNGAVAPPQLPEASTATQAKVIIVSVGADDLQWSEMTTLCAVATACNDKVSGAYFNQLLGNFTREYYALLSDLISLPQHPAVLVNEYYSPFGSSIGCLARYGMTPAKEHVLLSRLNALNLVLAEGAEAFGFHVAEPRFTGHELCTADPYVQGPGAPAPMHPNASGDLVIALADQQALPDLSSPATVTPGQTPSPWESHVSAAG